MLEEKFEKLYLLFRANYYKRMVEKIGTREGSLSATESYCVEIIYLLNGPTISEFAQYLGISLPNANYKINCLAEKGYVHKKPSANDKRECHLHVTEKFLNYYGLNDADNAQLMCRIRQSFTDEEILRLEDTIDRVLELMQPPGEET